MSVGEWILVLSLGAGLGAIGQLVRTIAGLAKNARTQSATPARAEPIDLSQLLIGVLIGATAGVVAAVAMHKSFIDANGKLISDVSVQLLLGLIAAGYAGADFIEGFAGKYLGKTTTPQVTVVTPVADGSVG